MSVATSIASILRSAAPALLLALDDTPPGVVATWVLTISFLLHVPACASDLFDKPRTIPVWLHALPLCAMLGLLLAVAGFGFAYAVGTESAAVALAWGAAVPSGYTALRWAKQPRGTSSHSTNPVVAAKSPSNTTPPPPAATVPNKGPYVALCIAAAVAPAIMFIGGFSWGMFAAAAGAILSVLFLELFSAVIAGCGLTAFTVACPAFAVAAIAAVVGSVSGAPGTDGSKFTGATPLSAFGWAGSAERFGLTAALGVACTLVGLSAFVHQQGLQLMASPQGRALRAVIFFEPIAGVVLAAAIADEGFPDTFVLIGGAVAVVLTQLVLGLTAMQATNMAPTTPMLASVFAKVGGRTSAKPHFANLQTLVGVDVTIGGSGAPEASGHVESHPPLTHQPSSVLSLRELDANIDLKTRRKSISTNLTSAKKQRLRAILRKHGVMSKADLGGKELPPNMVAIAEAVLMPSPTRRASLESVASASTGVRSDSRGSDSVTAAKPRRNSLSRGPAMMMPVPAAAAAAALAATPDLPVEEAAMQPAPTAASNGLAESLDKLDKKELLQVLELLDFYDIKCREDMESSDMPKDVRNYLTRLVPLSSMPARASLPGVQGEKPKPPNARRNSQTALTADRIKTVSVDLETVMKAPAPARKKLAPLKATSQVLPGAIMTPIPSTTGAGKFTFGDSLQRMKQRKPFDAGVTIREIPQSPDSQEDDGWEAAVKAVPAPKPSPMRPKAPEPKTKKGASSTPLWMSPKAAGSASGTPEAARRQAAAAAALASGGSAHTLADSLKSPKGKATPTKGKRRIRRVRKKV